MSEEPLWFVDNEDENVEIYKKYINHSIYLYCYSDNIPIVFYREDVEKFSKKKAINFVYMLFDEIKNPNRKIYYTCAESFIKFFVEKEIYEEIIKRVNFKVIYSECYIDIIEIYMRCNTIINKLSISEEKKFYNQFLIYKIIETLC